MGFEPMTSHIQTTDFNDRIASHATGGMPPPPPFETYRGDMPHPTTSLSLPT